MTIAALRAIQDAEQPDVPRPAAPPLHRRAAGTPQEAPAVHRGAPESPTSAVEEPTAPAEEIPSLAELLAWARAHDDAAVRKHATAAAEALTALRERRRVDAELERITTEAGELEQRLAQLRARESELRPAARKKSAKAERDYDPAVVRVWARREGIECPDRGRVPVSVLDAWRAAGSPRSAV